MAILLIGMKSAALNSKQSSAKPEIHLTRLRGDSIRISFVYLLGSSSSGKVQEDEVCVWKASELFKLATATESQRWYYDAVSPTINIISGVP